MQKFLQIRAAIDSLIDETKESIKMKYHSESMEKLERARGLIQELKEMSTTEQTGIVFKREMTVAGLTDIAGNLKKPVVKKRGMKKTLEPAAAL